MICQFCRKKLTKSQKKKRIKVGKIVERLADYKWNYVKLYIHDFCHGGYLARKRMLEAIAPEPETTVHYSVVGTWQHISDELVEDAAKQLAEIIDQDILTAIKGEKP